MSFLHKLHNDPKIFGQTGPLGKANKYYLMGNFKSAIEEYTKHLSTDPKSFQAHRNRGLVYFKQNNFSKAIEDFEAIIKEGCEDTNVIYAKGLCHYKQNEEENALTDFSKVIYLDKTHTGALNNRAAIFTKKNMIKEALEDYNLVIKVDPSFFHYYNRCVLNYKQKNYTDVINDAKKVVTDTKCTDKKMKSTMYYYSGWSNYQLGEPNWDEAIKQYGNSIKQDPKHDLAFNNRGIIYFKKGMKNEAEKDFRKAIQINPNKQSYKKNLELVA